MMESAPHNARLIYLDYVKERLNACGDTEALQHWEFDWQYGSVNNVELLLEAANRSGSHVTAARSKDHYTFLDSLQPRNHRVGHVVTLDSRPHSLGEFARSADLVLLAGVSTSTDVRSVVKHLVDTAGSTNIAVVSDACVDADVYTHRGALADMCRDLHVDVTTTTDAISALTARTRGAPAGAVSSAPILAPTAWLADSSSAPTS